MRRFYLPIIFLAFPLLLSSLGAHADILQGKITGIADGDTVYVTDSSQREYKIRLLGIDTPEYQQPYGEAAKLALKKFAYQQSAKIEWQHRDQYGRLIGKVMLANGQDIGLAQLRAGLAWWNKKFAFEQTDADAILYREAEFAARKQRSGLWSQQNPVPPWRWRYANRQQKDAVKP